MKALRPFVAAAWPQLAGFALRPPSVRAAGAWCATARGGFTGRPREAAVPFPYWLPMRSSGTTADIPPAPVLAPAPAPTSVLVKVGDAGRFSLIKDFGIMAEDRMSLLDTLASSKHFAAKLTSVLLDECAVWVCASASGKAPSPAEAAASCELEGSVTLGALAADLVTAAGVNLFVHVILPAGTSAAAVQGELPARVSISRIVSRGDDCPPLITFLLHRPISARALPRHRSTSRAGRNYAVPLGSADSRGRVGRHGPAGTSYGGSSWKATRIAGADPVAY